MAEAQPVGPMTPAQGRKAAAKRSRSIEKLADVRKSNAEKLAKATKPLFTTANPVD